MAKGAQTTSTERTRGSVKEAIGKITGDAGIEAEGRRQKGEDPPSKDAGSRKA